MKQGKTIKALLFSALLIALLAMLCLSGKPLPPAISEAQVKAIVQKAEAGNAETRNTGGTVFRQDMLLSMQIIEAENGTRASVQSLANKLLGAGDAKAAEEWRGFGERVERQNLMLQLATGGALLAAVTAFIARTMRNRARTANTQADTSIAGLLDAALVTAFQMIFFIGMILIISRMGGGGSPIQMLLYCALWFLSFATCKHFHSWRDASKNAGVQAADNGAGVLELAAIAVVVLPLFSLPVPYPWQPVVGSILVILGLYLPWLVLFFAKLYRHLRRQAAAAMVFQAVAGLIIWWFTIPG